MTSKVLVDTVIVELRILEARASVPTRKPDFSKKIAHACPSVRQSVTRIKIISSYVNRNVNIITFEVNPYWYFKIPWLYTY
jgi:hypothetical protein